ncbi:MAG: hypothetical protein AB7P69_13855 [Candidatus Binatia bacterium]
MTTEQMERSEALATPSPTRQEPTGIGKLWQRLFRTRSREALERARRRLAEHEEIDEKKEAFLRCPKCGESLEKISS